MGSSSTRENLSRILLVEQDPTRRVNVFVVSAFIDQQNAFRRNNNVNFLVWRAMDINSLRIVFIPFPTMLGNTNSATPIFLRPRTNEMWFNTPRAAEPKPAQGAALGREAIGHPD